MLKKIAFFTILLSFSAAAFSQNNSDSIRVNTSFWTGTKFYANGSNLSPKDVENLVKINPEAFSQFKKAKSTTLIANIIAGAGGALIGYPIGYAIGGGKPQWIMAGIGAGLIVLDIPLIISANKKYQKAISTYNAGVNSATQSFKYDLNLEAKNGGLAFVIRF